MLFYCLTVLDFTVYRWESREHMVPHRQVVRQQLARQTDRPTDRQTVEPQSCVLHSVQCGCCVAAVWLFSPCSGCAACRPSLTEPGNFPVGPATGRANICISYKRFQCACCCCSCCLVKHLPASPPAALPHHAPLPARAPRPEWLAGAAGAEVGCSSWSTRRPSARRKKEDDESRRAASSSAKMAVGH